MTTRFRQSGKSLFLLAICRLLLPLMKKRSRRPGDKPRFIVSTSSGLGDFVMATPFYQQLEKRYGAGCIDFLVFNAWPIEEILKAFSFTGSFYRVKGYGIMEMFKALPWLRARPIDCFFQPYDSPSSTSSALAVLSGAFDSAGHIFPRADRRPRWYESGLKRKVPIRLGASATDLHLDLLPPEFPRQPDLRRIMPHWEHPGLLDRFNLTEGDYVVLQPGAANGLISPRIWPLSHLVVLAEKISALGKTVVLVGSKPEKNAGEEFGKLAKCPFVNLIGQTTLPELASIIERAKAVVSHDSGVIHVAAAYDTPYIVIFGSADLQQNRPGSKVGHLVRNEKLSCIGCRSNFALTESEAAAACTRNFECMTSVSAEEIFAILKDKIFAQR